jgi:hypothetical protein
MVPRLVPYCECNDHAITAAFKNVRACTNILNAAVISWSLHSQYCNIVGAKSPNNCNCSIRQCSNNIAVGSSGLSYLGVCFSFLALPVSCAPCRCNYNIAVRCKIVPTLYFLFIPAITSQLFDWEDTAWVSKLRLRSRPGRLMPCRFPASDIRFGRSCIAHGGFSILLEEFWYKLAPTSYKYGTAAALKLGSSL